MGETRYQIDLLNAMNEKLISNDRMMQTIVGTSNNAFLYYDFHSEKVNVFGNWEHFFQVRISNKRDLAKLYDLFEEEYLHELREVFQLEWTSKDRRNVCARMKESHLYVNVDATVIYDSLGEPTDKVIRFEDVTKYMMQNDELEFMAYFDPLTGLHNRNHFVMLLGEQIRQAEAENTSVSVMFIDINDFRKINDSLGIIVGDMLVQAFGQFLNEFSNEDVSVSHFNGDVFCISIYDPKNQNDVHKVYKKIVDRLQKPFLANGSQLHIEVTVGVAEYPVAANTPLELINCAEIVMFKAKAKGAGKNAIRYYDSGIMEDFLNYIEMENKLKNALEMNQFSIFFQPQYHTIGKKLRGVEALLRWKDENGNFIGPGEFIPIAEKNGNIIPIGAYVIDESIRIFMEWKKNYSFPLILSINVSAIQYKQPDFVEQIMRSIRKYHMKPEELELELTESVLIDDYQLITEKLAVLRDCGIKISLDDFGTGYSSLSYLKGLPLDTLKIDKSFVDTISTDANSQIILESIMYMVKKLGLETIAEGVETEEQFFYLDNIECDNIQGYFLGKPMSAEDIEREILRKI